VGLQPLTQESQQPPLTRLVPQLGAPAWCPRFSVAEGELTWDCREFKIFGWFKDSPAQSLP